MSGVMSTTVASTLSFTAMLLPARATSTRPTTIQENDQRRMLTDLIKGLIIGFGLGFFIGSILGYRIGQYREE